MMSDVQLENGSLNETQTHTCLVSNMLSFLVNHLVIPIFRMITLIFFFHLLEWNTILLKLALHLALGLFLSLMKGSNATRSRHVLVT